MNVWTCEGVVESVGEVKEFGTRGFRKREFVVSSVEAEKKRFVCLELKGDDVDKVNEISVGCQLRILAMPESRYWDGKDGIRRCLTALTAERK